MLRARTRTERRLGPGRRVLAAVACLAFAAALVPAVSAAPGFPETIDLPNGFEPEGIANGRGKQLFVGSIPTGAVYATDARTGEGEVRVAGREGRSAIGIEVDRRNRIFVAGGMTGQVYVYDAESGSDLAAYRVAPPGAETFVNDVVVTRRAAYFTDSLRQQLYVLPLGRGGRLPREDRVRTLPLTGDISYTEGFNANGIETAPRGRDLIIVQSNTGKLFRVDRRSGVTREVDLGGSDVTNGDGLLRRGRTLLVVQNRDNRIAAVRLDRRARSGRVARLIRDRDFDVPTTLAEVAGRLYTVNARFGTAPGPEVEYDVVKVGGSGR